MVVSLHLYLFPPHVPVTQCSVSASSCWEYYFPRGKESSRHRVGRSPVGLQWSSGQDLLSAGPNLLLMPFSPLSAKVGLLSGCLGKGLCLVMFRKRLSSSQPAQRSFGNWLSNFDLIAPFKAHGLDFPANIPGVTQKSRWFFLQQLTPLQGHIDRKEVSWSSLQSGGSVPWPQFSVKCNPCLYCRSQKDSSAAHAGE